MREAGAEFGKGASGKIIATIQIQCDLKITKRRDTCRAAVLNYSADWRGQSLFLQECRGLWWRMGAFIDTSIWETLILPPSSPLAISLNAGFLSVYLFFYSQRSLQSVARWTSSHMLLWQRRCWNYAKYFVSFIFLYRHHIPIKIGCIESRDKTSLKTALTIMVCIYQLCCIASTHRPSCQFCLCVNFTMQF